MKISLPKDLIKNLTKNKLMVKCKTKLTKYKKIEPKVMDRTLNNKNKNLKMLLVLYKHNNEQSKQNNHKINLITKKTF